MLSVNFVPVTTLTSFPSWVSPAAALELGTFMLSVKLIDIMLSMLAFNELLNSSMGSCLLGLKSFDDTDLRKSRSLDVTDFMISDWFITIPKFAEKPRLFVDISDDSLKVSANFLAVRKLIDIDSLSPLSATGSIGSACLAWSLCKSRRRWPVRLAAFLVLNVLRRDGRRAGAASLALSPPGGKSLSEVSASLYTPVCCP
mmetsp:Transcript_29155/g.65816  ORF Transcript_29155/g.65816 Transcript_29155/m.65816 type:complete len:200 (-) Transcript_29155:56-655(-)